MPVTRKLKILFLSLTLSLLFGCVTPPIKYSDADKVRKNISAENFDEEFSKLIAGGNFINKDGYSYTVAKMKLDSAARSFDFIKNLYPEGTCRGGNDIEKNLFIFPALQTKEGGKYSTWSNVIDISKKTNVPEDQVNVYKYKNSKSQFKSANESSIVCFDYSVNKNGVKQLKPNRVFLLGINKENTTGLYGEFYFIYIGAELSKRMLYEGVSNAELQSMQSKLLF